MSEDWSLKSHDPSHEVLAVHEYDPFESNEKPCEPSSGASGHRLRRFYFRSIVGVVAPLVVLAYYFTIWRIYLAPIDPSAEFVVGPPGANYVYYGWFIAGIVGLNLSMYSLAGVEAAMLMHPTWDVGDAMALMMHADGTWSGPGGWVKTMKRLMRMRKAPAGSAWPSRLWFVLALPSAIVFVSWPLSGLTFEMTSGFIRGASGPAASPNVRGFSYASFNERHQDDAINGAFVTWNYAQDAAIPGKGIIYTPPGVAKFSQPLLPKDDGVSRAFLTAQAANPIEGRSWGLALRYNCSVVTDMSEFSLLSYQKPVQPPALTNSSSGKPIMRLQTKVPDAAIYRISETYSNNLYAVAEFTYQSWPNASAYQQFKEVDHDNWWLKNQRCYNNPYPSISGDYPGLGEEDVFELVLWQYLGQPSYTDPPPKYNGTIVDSIADLYGVYNTSVNNDADSSFIIQPMTAIGVRCSSSANVGTADIDDVHSTYTNFVRTDTPTNFQTVRCAKRFGAASLVDMFPGFSTVAQYGGPKNTTVVDAFISSSGAPGPFYAAYDTYEPVDAGTGTMLQESCLQPSDLRKSLLRGYAAYATQLMFNGGHGYTAVDGTQTTFMNPNVTEFTVGSVLTHGIVQPWVPASLFLVWSVTVPLLCVMYGFRRRWSPTLDGYSLFRFGADISEAGKSRIAAFSNTREVEDCQALHGLPGFVGDKRPQAWVGQIGLVDGVRATTKSKLYE